MKTKSLLATGALLAVSALTANAAIVITEVMSSSAHPGGTNNADWFELTNTGVSAVNVTGWSWDDDSNTPDTATFGSLTSIAAGASVIISQETIGAESSWISNWGLSGVTVVNIGSGGSVPGFSNAGDTIYIYDATDTLVTSVTFGAASSGFSFEWDASGNSLGLSAIGVNGAFQAVSNGASAAGVDVGSPGFAVVPEPSTYAALAGFVMLGVALNRRRRQAKHA